MYINVGVCVMFFLSNIFFFVLPCSVLYNVIVHAQMCLPVVVPCPSLLLSVLPPPETQGPAPTSVANLWKEYDELTELVEALKEKQGKGRGEVEVGGEK